MWAEQGIRWLFINIVPTDIDALVPPLHEFEDPLSVNVGILGTDECHTAASASSLMVKRRLSSVLFKVGKKWKSLGAR
jgi:hypothetical protein